MRTKAESPADSTSCPVLEREYSFAALFCCSKYMTVKRVVSEFVSGLDGTSVTVVEAARVASGDLAHGISNGTEFDLSFIY